MQYLQKEFEFFTNLNLECSTFRKIKSLIRKICEKTPVEQGRRQAFQKGGVHREFKIMPLTMVER